MSKKLYIGNLPYTATDSQVKDLFSQAGTVESVMIPTDKMSGRPRGFGFVEMADDEGAQKAMESFNGYDMEGRKLVVNEARPMAERPPRRSFGGGSGGDRGGFGGGRGGFGGSRGGDRY